MPNNYQSSVGNSQSAGYSKENRLFKPGEYNISFNSYISSKMGLSNDTNRDNYYINGISGKSFKYSDAERPYTSEYSDCGVFAVSSGINSDRASKLIMRFIDEKRAWLADSKGVIQLKKRISELVQYCNINLINEGKKTNSSLEASLAVCVYMRRNIVYAVCGDCAAVTVRNKKARQFKSRCGNLGAHALLKPYVGVCDFDGRKRLLMLSKGVIKNNAPVILCYQTSDRDTPEEAAKKIIANVGYINNEDSTCISIKANPAKGIYTKTIILAGICMVLTLFNCILLTMK